MDTVFKIILVFLVGVVIGLFLIVFLQITKHRTYSDGQIDCINGNIYYELVIQTDNTTKWELIDKE